jgi:SAM-dependent methyltransferase
MKSVPEQEALQWQVGVWDRISQLYLCEIDPRFAPVVEGVIGRAGLKSGEKVLDLGTGTGSLAIEAATLVGATGRVTALDISPEMLSLAKGRVAASGRTNIELREGRAEEIPAEDAAFDVVLASLSLMYVIDRAAAARELRRVLRPDGRVVAQCGPVRTVRHCSADGGKVCTTATGFRGRPRGTRRSGSFPGATGARRNYRAC